MIYVLKLERPLGNAKHQAQYYVGYSKNKYTLGLRIEHHRKGCGSSFTRAAVKQGIGFDVVLIMEGDRSVERKIKNQKNTKRFVERQLAKNLLMER